MYGYGYKYTTQRAGGITYDPDAQAYFDELGDVPVYAKNAWNDFVVACKANNVWDLFSQTLAVLPTEEMFGGLVDAKTLTTTVVPYTSATVIAATPWLVPSIWTGSLGINCSLTGETRNGWIPSDHWTLNSSAWAMAFPTEADAEAGYTFGTFQSSTQSCAFIRRSAANVAQADMYGSNTASGRLEKTSVGGTEGVWIANRSSNVLYKLWFNGVVQDTNTSTQGSLPTLQTRFFNIG